MAADTPNETLSQLLAGLSWSGERLAREICRVLGTGAVHPTAPYKWLKGHRPRWDEVRQATAFVLSQAGSHPVAVGELWSGCAPHDPRLAPRRIDGSSRVHGGGWLGPDTCGVGPIHPGEYDVRMGYQFLDHGINVRPQGSCFGDG